MTSQTGTQAITIKILPDISKSKNSQRKKLGQLSQVRNWDKETNSRPLLSFKKV